MARVVGPILAGASFDHLGIAWPYLLGAGLAALAALVAFTLRQPEHGAEGRGDAHPLPAPL
jgi:hypothetical protein